MIRHEVDGWVCPDVTAESVAEGLAYFLVDPERTRRASEQARDSERAFSRSRFMAEWAEVFAAHGAAVASPVHIQPS